MNDHDDVSITVTDLRREYGAVTALDGIDLDIDDPQIVGVAGPNGSGKMTLIQCLLGLLQPTDGDIRVNGTNPLQYSNSDRARLGTSRNTNRSTGSSRSARTWISSPGCIASTTGRRPLTAPSRS